MRFTVQVLCALLLAGVAGAQPGRLVIIGGGLSSNNEAVYRAILDGRKGSGPLCIIPTAGATPETAMDGPVRNFERYGGAGSARGVLISSQQPQTAHDSSVVAHLRACSGFYFIGGVQSRVTAAFRPDGKSTPAYEALMQRWREGAVVSGSSAGAAIMSDPMIAGGTSAAAFPRGVRRLDGAAAEAEDSTGGMSVSHGLGLFPDALADQHFLARGRFGRLLVALIDLGTFDLAFGIDENTSLVVDGPRVRTVGASAVAIFDMKGATRRDRSASNITMHLMGDGDAFDLATRTLTLAPEKSPLGAARLDSLATAAPASNIFAPWVFLNTLDAFGRSLRRELTWTVPGGAITLRKTGAFRAVSADGAGVQSAAARLGVTGLQMDVRRP
jgi:cyanophycinase